MEKIADADEARWQSRAGWSRSNAASVLRIPRPVEWRASTTTRRMIARIQRHLANTAGRNYAQRGACAMVRSGGNRSDAAALAPTAPCRRGAA
jgi:hypothetical protein